MNIKYEIMIEWNIHTSSDSWKDIPPRDNRRVICYTGLLVQDRLQTPQKNNFDDFLRELINQCRVQIHSTEEQIDQHTQISVTSRDQEVYYSTVWELIQYLNQSNNPDDHTILIDFFRRTFVVMNFQAN